jgi:DNA-binding PadR family transcriptional regulator
MRASRRGPNRPHENRDGRRRGGWDGPPPPPEFSPEFGPGAGPGRGRGRGHGRHGGGDHEEDGPGGGRHRRTRRGEIRTGLLAILVEGPGHGYELIQRIEAKTGGAWKPSPGSIYPTLQLLQDEGLVTAVDRDGKRVFELTEDGRAEATRRQDESGEDPWSRGGGGRPQTMQLFEAMKQLHLAARQVVMTGNPTQIEATVAIVTEARKKLYQLLAAD